MGESWSDIVAASGISEEQIRRCADIYIRSKATIICYGMGITQHQMGSQLVQQVANLLLLRGNFGKPGAGISPIRSEEHTSELQSLMRISYAVFCLKKKQNSRSQKYNRYLK